MQIEKISLRERERMGKQGECDYDYDCPTKYMGWCYSEHQCRYKIVMRKDGTKYWLGLEAQGEELE